jgi:Type ISP C-terminal specificity domain
LRKRIEAYFDPKLPNALAQAEMPEAFIATAQFDPQKVRAALSKRGVLQDRFVKYLYRPFDFRWLYWEHENGLLSRRSPDLFEACGAGNNFLEAREKQTGEEFSRGTVTSVLPDNFGNGFSNFFPLFLREHSSTGGVLRPNLRNLSRVFLRNVSWDRRRSSGMWQQSSTLEHIVRKMRPPFAWIGPEYRFPARRSCFGLPLILARR